MNKYIFITPFDSKGELQKKTMLSLKMIDVIGHFKGKTTITSIQYEKSWQVKESVATVRKLIYENSDVNTMINTFNRYIDVMKHNNETSKSQQEQEILKNFDDLTDSFPNARPNELLRLAIKKDEDSQLFSKYITNNHE